MSYGLQIFREIEYSGYRQHVMELCLSFVNRLLARVIRGAHVAPLAKIWPIRICQTQN